VIGKLYEGSQRKSSSPVTDNQVPGSSDDWAELS